LSSSGPLRLARLTSIRDFPDPPENESAAASDLFLNAEAQIVNSDSYLPLSELDLRRLTQDARQFLADCSQQFPDISPSSIVLSGVNSAHPCIASLLEDALQIPVYLSRPLATQGVGLFSPDAPLVLQSLGRVVGLGLSFLPPAQTLSDESVDEAFTSRLPKISLPQDREMPVDDVQGPWADPPISVGEPKESSADDPSAEMASEVELKVSARTLILGSSDQGENFVPSSVEDSGNSSVDFGQSVEPIFSFGSDRNEASFIQALPATPLNEQEKAVYPEENQDEVPFSMDDLLNSFTTKDTALEEVISEDVEVVPQLQDEEKIYLVDDPALWPSISKGQEFDNSVGDDSNDHQDGLIS
jgi:hypothetical protein